MSAAPREAAREYSKAQWVLQAPWAAGPRVRGAVLAGGLIGAVLLVVAELSPLLVVRAGHHVVGRVGTGSHHSWALLAIAVAAAGLTVVGTRSGSRPALAALVWLGAIALVIALAIDLPDARATGLVARTLQLGAASPQAGFFLETAAAVVLVVVGGLALLASPARSGQ
jgi:hypothetical protein